MNKLLLACIVATFTTQLAAADANALELDASAVERNLRTNIDSSASGTAGAAAGLEEKTCYFLGWKSLPYTCSGLLALLASANAAGTGTSTLLTERNLRDESASLTGSAADEKVCYLLFWPFQC
ncbi:uncharacterized protein KRP23_14982 [Phytophthora ramorum]|uniref:uncharacterized protein n=1 Tax=Phytophthora ramorum TaxID=164328 RepID=UPI0030ACEB2B|nr:hypothetical protein KRP23_14982 [Phytophthora ramorum]